VKKLKDSSAQKIVSRRTFLKSTSGAVVGGAVFGALPLEDLANKSFRLAKTPQTLA